MPCIVVTYSDLTMYLIDLATLGQGRCVFLQASHLPASDNPFEPRSKVRSLYFWCFRGVLPRSCPPLPSPSDTGDPPGKRQRQPRTLAISKHSKRLPSQSPVLVDIPEKRVALSREQLAELPSSTKQRGTLRHCIDHPPPCESGRRVSRNSVNRPGIAGDSID